MKWLTKSTILATIIFTVVSGLAVGSRSYAVSEQLPDQKKLAAIESVLPSGDGASTELLIKLSSPATYTTYKTASPLRLVVDFSQATQGALSEPVVINRGNFKTVTASRFDTDAGVLTRLDIELVQDSEAVLSVSPANSGEIKISFPALSEAVPVAAEKQTPEKAATEKVVAAETVNAVPPVAAEAAPALGKETASPSSSALTADTSRTLTAITAGKDTILLALDGPAPEFKSFRLNNPERLVIDLTDVKSTLLSRLLPLNVAGVASARIGLYPGKLRVVLDSVNGTFPETSLASTPAGVVISLNVTAPPSAENPNTKLTATHSAPVVSDSQAVKPVSAPAEHKVPEKAAAVDKQEPVKKTSKAVSPNQTATVEMIDFQVIDGISRVSVKVAGDVIADQPVQTSGFVTLTIKNALLPKKLQRSCLLYTSPSPRDRTRSRMPSSA